MLAAASSAASKEAATEEVWVYRTLKMHPRRELKTPVGTSWGNSEDMKGTPPSQRVGGFKMVVLTSPPVHRWSFGHNNINNYTISAHF